MKKNLFGVLAIATVIAALAAPLSAQSVRLTATIPFEFTVGGKTLPAGDYTISNDISASALMFAGGEKGSHALVLTQPSGGVAWSSESKVTFNRYGDRYILTEVSSGPTATGRVVRLSREERELTAASAPQKYEILAFLARR